MALSWCSFIVGALISLSCSWVLVTRLERLGERFGLSEALLGVAAALAADAPEITSSISALAQHQRQIGAGVVIGSNLFNLAALLGLGAIISGFIALHRKVVVLGGVVALWIALCCVATTFAVIPVPVALAAALVVLLCYVVILGARAETVRRFALNPRISNWLSSAVNEEELELQSAIRPPRGRRIDGVVATSSLVVVVLASIAMERGGTTLGHHFHVPNAVIGGLVLAAVTSLPNAVAAIHLATKGRGAAAFSTALNSNNLNVVAGLLIPGVVVGLATPTVSGYFISGSFLVLTTFVLVFALVRNGLTRRAGVVIMLAYVLFLIGLLSVS